ncbi:hypothetical protein BDW74DRAFT_174856 [Aspergillus multicolor]|uniref:uncharacterized protein n=1 Tax=Aspergillus multicolor TaxID=41759 RepID=UPI003CCD0B1B
MFGVTGVGLSVVKTYANEGKKARWNRDLWDRVRIPSPFDFYLISTARFSARLARNALADISLAKDLRLTGTLRGQSTNPEAPKGFELNNPWKVEKRMY